MPRVCRVGPAIVIKSRRKASGSGCARLTIAYPCTPLHSTMRSGKSKPSLIRLQPHFRQVNIPLNST